MATFKAATFMGDQKWDAVIIVQYPSMKHLVKMATDMPEYTAIAHWRSEALSDFGFVAMRPGWVRSAAADPTAVAAASAGPAKPVTEWTVRRWYAEPHAFRHTRGHELSSALLEDPRLGGQQRIWCINLLKFKAGKGSHPGMPDAGGEETYMSGYGEPVTEMIYKDYGGALVYAKGAKASGRPVTVVPPKDAAGNSLGVQYDQVAIAQYPSRDAFLSMLHSAEYQAINKYREAGLEMQQLISVVPEAVSLEDGSVVGDDAVGGATRVLLTAPLADTGKCRL